MINVSTEDVISLAEAATLLPRRRAGKKAHVSCIYRWTQQGCRGVRLESIQVGGTRCTSRQALTRFFDKLTVATGLPPASDQKPASFQRRTETAERELDRLGI